MNDLINKVQAEFQDKEYRHSYAEECLNTMIATQIKVLREQRGMTQGELADVTGMKQPRIPLLEDINYENWTINTLKRFARAFDVALSVKFETFSHVLQEFEALNRERLQRPEFATDVEFHRPRVRHRRQRRQRTTPNRMGFRTWNFRRITQPQNSEMGLIKKPPKSTGQIKGKDDQQAANMGLQFAASAGGTR